MIHITLIDYKRLYEDSLSKLEEKEDELVRIEREVRVLKEVHNEDALRCRKIEEAICNLKVDHLERDERLCDLLGGEGSLEDRVNNTSKIIYHLNTALQYSHEQINSKDARIAELMKEGITDKDEALLELHQSYQRLQDDYYSLSELYDNAQKTIDRLCSNE